MSVATRLNLYKQVLGAQKTVKNQELNKNEIMDGESRCVHALKWVCDAQKTVKQYIGGDRWVLNPQVSA